MKLLENTREVLKSIKHKRPTRIFCPRCACADLKPTVGFAGMDMWLTPKKYICEKCGYSGPIFMELEKEENG
jgi:hypothetical protein